MKVASTDGTQYYEVTRFSCTCPDFVYRKAKVGQICKHIAKMFFNVPESLEPEQPEDVRVAKWFETQEVTDYFKLGVKFNEAMNKYGHDKMMELIKNFVVAEVWSSGGGEEHREFKLM